MAISTIGTNSLGSGAVTSAKLAAAQTLSVNGITFPATQSASADANTLDDYEEGTWTPVPGNGTISEVLSAKYTKIGNLVTVQFWFQSFGTVTSSTISGLPFTSANFYYSPAIIHNNANVLAVARVASSSSNNIILLNLVDSGVALNSFGSFAIATVTYQVA